MKYEKVTDLPTRYTLIGTTKHVKSSSQELYVTLQEAVQILPDLRAIFLKRHYTLVPYLVKHATKLAHKAIFQLADVGPQEMNELARARVFIPSAAGHPLDQQPLMGYTVTDGQLGHLGTVEDVYTPSVQSIIAVRYQAEELLIPYVDAIVKQVDKQQQRIVVDLPKGFLEVSKD